MIKIEQEQFNTAYKLKIGQKIYLVFKAGFDFIFALLMLIVLIPLFIVVAIAIKIDSKGPVFFCQKRIGRKGKEFTIVKFRSMTLDANHSVATYKYKQVSGKITKVGRVLRKLSIDELPQLFCVLTFKMSLIGYRPAQDNELELNQAREEYNMYQIRPGLTGWAQINGRDVVARIPKKKAKLDFYYLQNVSPWLDIKIFFKTIIKVIIADGVKYVSKDNDKSNQKEKQVKKDQGQKEAVVTEYMAEKDKENKDVG